MVKTVLIGSKEVEMAATAASPHHYRARFKRDALRTFELINEGKIEQSEGVELFIELGYIMARTAQKADMFHLKEEDYYDWLEGFDYMDLIDASQDIAQVFFKGKLQLSSPKKE